MPVTVVTAENIPSAPDADSTAEGSFLRMFETPPILLIIAGSDPTGGAGMQADIKTACVHHVYATTAVTSVTSQTSGGVIKAQAVNDDLIESQIEAVLTDMHPDAVKIGMLPTASAAMTIGQIISRHCLTNVVVDPVLAPTAGNPLNDNRISLARALVKHIFPLARVVTPNIPEASFLLEASGSKGSSDISNPRLMAEMLMNISGTESVLLKGGHADPKEPMSTDILVRRECNKILKFSSKRIKNARFHGTGCTLSSTIACGLALGLDLDEAIGMGRRYISSAMTGNKIIHCIGSDMLDFFQK